MTTREENRIHVPSGPSDGAADGNGGAPPPSQPPVGEAPRPSNPAPVNTFGGLLPAWVPRAAYAAAAALGLLFYLVFGMNWLIAAIFATAIGATAVYALSRAREGARRAKDRTVTALVISSFAVAVLPLVSLLFTVIDRGLVRFDIAFLTESARNVVGAGGGAQHAIVGTLVITLVAALASVPIGILTGIYLHEYGRGKLKAALIFFVDVMTGIPSIVAGLFAFALFAIFMGPGVRLGVMGAVALSILMIPIVVRSTEEMLKIVPNSLREASYALGVPKWKTIIKVVLPTALAGIVTGVMVAIARVIGETAPLLITTGTFSSVNWNPFSGRMENLPVFTYSQYKYPGVPPEPYIDRAWAAALTLILLVMTLNLIARLIYRRFGKDVHQ